MRRRSLVLWIAIVALSLIMSACAQQSTQQPAATATAAPKAAVQPTTAPATQPTTAPAAQPTAAAKPAATAAATTAAPATQPTAAAAAPSGGAAAIKLNPSVSGNIELWHFWSSPLRRTAIRRVVSLCQAKLPNIKITETPKPFGDIWTANIAAVAAGSGMPDVIVEDRPQLVQRASDKIATNLGELAKRDGVTGAQFWPFTWNEATVNGDPYGIPFETDVRVLYWNKVAFKEAGLDPEKPPKTWEELEQFADKLDKKNPDGTWARIGFHPDLGNAGWNLWARTNGAQLVQNGKPAATDPKLVQTMEWIKKWYDRYGGYNEFAKFRGGFGAPPNDAFMSGKVAMIVDINGYSSVLNFYNPRVPSTDAAGKVTQVALDLGVADVPYSSSYGKPASWSGGFALSIPRGSKNVDPAWEFIKCATGPEGAASWSRDTYAMSANVAAAADPALMGDPRWQFFLNAMKYSQGTDVVAKYPGWGQEIDNRREKMMQGQTPMAQGMQEAQAAIDTQMAK
ncbi:MAG: ABC transporter substrate-binding protein [Anaerolineae bacterium]|nr:ABC transporter substrate-binding protein [Anaerolineae bacterium]